MIRQYCVTDSRGISREHLAISNHRLFSHLGCLKNWNAIVSRTVDQEIGLKPFPMRLPETINKPEDIDVTRNTFKLKPECVNGQITHFSYKMTILLTQTKQKFSHDQKLN